MSSRYVTLADGRRVGLGAYVNAWRQCLAISPDTPIGPGVSGWGQTAGEALRDLRFGLHDRINHHIPGFGRGRKWSDTWQADTKRTARDVNTPRLIVRWAPPDLRDRLAHRLADTEYLPAPTPARLRHIERRREASKNNPITFCYG